MKKSKYRTRMEEIGAHVQRVVEQSDCELLLLKAHLLIERVLVATAATRLRENDHEAVPKMSFSTLIDLATAKDEKRKALIWFNDLRNSLTHEFNALDSDEFRHTIECFGIKWPRAVKARIVVLHALVNYVMLISWETYLDHSVDQLTLERAPKLSEDAKPFLEKAVEIVDAVRKARELLDSLRDLSDSSAQGTSFSLPPPPTQD